MEFKIGDAVRLKSGGPTMIISSIKGDIIKCQWIGQEKESIVCRHFLEISVTKKRVPYFKNQVSA